jgi:hypothetical protein
MPPYRAFEVEVDLLQVAPLPHLVEPLHSFDPDYIGPPPEPEGPESYVCDICGEPLRDQVESTTCGPGCAEALRLLEADDRA